MQYKTMIFQHYFLPLQQTFKMTIMTPEERDRQFKEALNVEAIKMGMKNIPDGVDINTLCTVGKSVFPDAEEELDKLVKDAPCFTFIGDYREPTLIGKGLVMFPTNTDKEQRLLIINFEKEIVTHYYRHRESRLEPWEPWEIKGKSSLHAPTSEGA